MYLKCTSYIPPVNLCEARAKSRIHKAFKVYTACGAIRNDRFVNDDPNAVRRSGGDFQTGERHNCRECERGERKRKTEEGRLENAESTPLRAEQSDRRVPSTQSKHKSGAMKLLMVLSFIHNGRHEYAEAFGLTLRVKCRDV